ncbi:hypothetical protein [uncultured Flavobacterium sp.]|uniref:hypothetical protein n=1 Tax=uncultured Flavobacterium sp. TaxID=165435 RepID=UPI0030ED8F60|tara:strand:+ start:17401 stop:17763 length:363 start_codon:yes stop_codon:yes gene_type:complete
MKSIILTILIVLFTNLIFSQTVSIDSLQHYEGKKVTICAKVQGIFISNKTKKTTFINFGKPYPKEKFVVVIFEKDLINFSYDIPTHLKNKTVCITGIVKMYKGKPEIVATKEEQIEIIDK